MTNYELVLPVLTKYVLANVSVISSMLSMPNMHKKGSVSAKTFKDVYAHFFAYCFWRQSLKEVTMQTWKFRCVGVGRRSTSIRTFEHYCTYKGWEYGAPFLKMFSLQQIISNYSTPG